MNVSRVLLPPDHPLPIAPKDAFEWGRVRWPAFWVGLPQGSAPHVAAFRLRVDWPADLGAVRLHVAAHERYEFFIDGQRVGSGSHRGAAHASVFDSYDVTLPAGRHTLVFRVWHLEDFAPRAQVRGEAGLFVCPESRALDTLLAAGVAPWETRRLPGLAFTKPRTGWGTGARETLDAAAYPWGFEHGLGSDWQPAVVTHPVHHSVGIEGGEAPTPAPASLPPMLEQPAPAPRVRHIDLPRNLWPSREPVLAARHLATEVPAWESFLAGRAPLTIPARTRRRVLLQFADYQCAFPELTVSGGVGARVSIAWAECLLNTHGRWSKPPRDEIEGKFFTLPGADDHEEADVLLPDGGAARRFRPLWWRVGLYVQLVVETADAPLTLDSLRFVETRYPLENESRFVSDEPRLADVIPIGFRSLQMCSHEHYMDCPYHEQLMYVGDTRVEALLTYTHCADDRLPRRALALFDASRVPNGLTASNFPNRYRQTIPPFSLWWIAMVRDLHLWRGHPGDVRACLPGVRTVLDAWLARRDTDGLYLSPKGWNYLDWIDAPRWRYGEPPVSATGAHPLLNWQLVIALRQAAELETALGEPECAARWARLADALGATLKSLLWDEQRALFADAPERTHFTEHAQCLASLAGAVPAASRERFARAFSAAAGGEAEPPGWRRASIYFSHYLFETCGELGTPAPLFARMADWYALRDWNLRTTYENCTPADTRSDCHAWGAHPLFHYHATLAGVRPAAPAFREVLVRPLPGPLTSLVSEIPHPQGRVRVDLRKEGGRWTGEIVLPEDVTGRFELENTRLSLHPGRNAIGA